MFLNLTKKITIVNIRVKYYSFKPSFLKQLS